MQASRIAAGLILVVAAGCAGTNPPASRPTLAEPIPIIIDHDGDSSDFGAIAILLRDPNVRVLAVTVAGTGLADCDSGLRTTRYLIRELADHAVPVGCGAEDGGPDARPFPDEWRAPAEASYGLPVVAGDSRPRPDAVTVLRDAILGSDTPPTIVVTGPWTNLEALLAADPSIASRIGRVHAETGTVDAGGSVDVDGHRYSEPLEWNAFADPSAVGAVLSSDIPVTLVPLDATGDVPVPDDLDDRIATDHAAGGADLVLGLLRAYPERTDPEYGHMLWDELAAMVLTDPDLATWEEARLRVDPDGSFHRDEAGRSVRFATSADRRSVEVALLAALRQGGPRASAGG